MVVRRNFPYSEFDPNGDYAYDQRWRLLTYDWTDINGDGNLWTDKDGDGAVDHKDFDNDLEHRRQPRREFRRSPRSTRTSTSGSCTTGPAPNALRIHVGDPAERSTDGLFIGFSHAEKSAAIPVTHFSITVDFYDNQDWSWLTTPASASGSFSATLAVPAGTPAGMYEGAIVASKGGHDTAIPVSLTVAVDAPQDSAETSPAA